MLDVYFLARQQNILNHAPPPAIPRSANSSQAMSQDTEATTESEVIPEISVVMVSVETLLDNDSQAAVQVMMEKIDGANNLPFQILTWQNQADNATPSLFSNQMNSFVIAHYFEPTI